MDELKNRLEAYAKKLENDLDYEMSEEMKEEYCSLQEEIGSYGDYELQNRFNEISEQYDNPDKLQDRILNDMFPDTDGEFDLDELWKD